MPLYRYRSVEEMPPPWKEADAPDNLREVAIMMAFYQRLHPREPASRGSVQRFTSVAQAKNARRDPYRREPAGRVSSLSTKDPR